MYCTLLYCIVLYYIDYDKLKDAMIDNFPKLER